MSKETRDIKTIFKEPELEAISKLTPMSEKDFSQFLNDILLNGVNHAIDIAEVDGKIVVVDGYTRYNVVELLLSQGKQIKGKLVYEIPVHDIGVMSRQEAKEWAFRQNHFRDTNTMYQRITVALVVGGRTQQQIRDLLNLESIRPIEDVAQLNKKIAKVPVRGVPVSVLEMIKGLQNGTEIEYSKIRSILSCAESVDARLRKKDITDDIRAHFLNDTKFVENKMYSSKQNTVLAELEEAIDALKHPKEVLTQKDQKKQDYNVGYELLKSKIEKFDRKYGEYMQVSTIKTEKDLKDTMSHVVGEVADFKAGDRVWFVAFFKIPEDKVKEEREEEQQQEQHHEETLQSLVDEEEQGKIKRKAERKVERERTKQAYLDTQVGATEEDAEQYVIETLGVE